MNWTTGTLAFAAGLIISVVTTPVGVSGAVFLLPVQVSVLGVPSPAVTPTNLLFNVIAVPGALLRHRRDGQLRGPLTRLMLAGTVPGVVVGAVIRVFVVPGPGVFRLLVAALLLPLGGWLCIRVWRPPAHHTAAEPRPRSIFALSLVVGMVGGVYGIGGGSLLSPILVNRGLPVATVTPAALASTFVTSLAGAASFAALATTSPNDIAPDWFVGLACGVGGLCGGYVGTRLRHRLPEPGLRLLLGLLAIGVATLYLVHTALS
ncbi:MAG TPA: sulfite exporter TauE/SafE family protein [Amycolatopsis sp.]|nr:sulfite exporter TauE/SafE family protein [Amycolatopsis sp.]